MFKKLGKKTKALGVVAGATILSVSAQAAVTYDEATGKISGAVDMGPYQSAIPIVLAVMGTTIVIGLMFKMFGQAKRG
ncbi:hypothetical protein [Halarcobacter sp.]|uniref:hypothetical protein n=1 Tax=Halarcobacter sp. TaxID=2321133 RepID=UPI003A902731